MRKAVAHLLLERAMTRRSAEKTGRIWEMDVMRKFDLLCATALVMLSGAPALAQQTTPAEEKTDDAGIGEIVVTAQRQSESLQSVPIAVSAFTAEALDKQQIENASDLQLTLPNVSFTKGNFTASSFTIRGIGDLCVGNSCDAATAIHVNGTPLLGTRLFETEYFDLERIEVLRGPQGTLFGRNATAGVVNFITAKPDLSGLKAAAEGEYGNYDSMKFKGMLNLPIGDTIGVRVAGYYSKRDGYTKNLFNNTSIDGRDMYAVRGSIRWQPSDTTTVDLMGYYFREKDDRARIQKQLCQRDATGVLGCLPDRLEFGATNNNSTFVGNLTSSEFFAINRIDPRFGLGSLYGPDNNSTFVNPANVRQVRTDFTPEYFTDEQQYQARLEQEFGSMKLQVTGLYQKTRVDSRQDYNINVADRSGYATALNTLQAAATGGLGAVLTPYFAPIAAAIIPNGPNGTLCVSETETSGVGAFGGLKRCSNTVAEFDRSTSKNRTWSAEAILSSDFDGPLNFLVGGIYVDSKTTDGDYYVNAFGIDYFTGVFGSFTSFSTIINPTTGQRLPPSFLGTPYFRNNAIENSLKSYGIFGEAYYDLSDKLKLTAGIRYNSDKKFSQARSTLASFLVPYGSTSAFASPFVGSFDADPGRAGNQLIQERSVKFSEVTGRAVLDYKISDRSLLYASFSRGYKSGGINPPLQPIFAVPEGFTPETVNAFEIGSKNTFANGKFQLNLTAFYYQYKSLQLSRIVARTAVNDNVDANIYGIEAEAIIKPSREVLVNMGFSYLHTKVSTDKFLSNPRDPSGGRSDAVIIKDITNGANCAIVPTVAGATAAVNGYVAAVNAGLGLRAPASFGPGTSLTANGAFSICSVLKANQGANFQVLDAGVEVNIKGNELPQAPVAKFSIGAQYTAEFDNGMTLVPRVDLSYTGDQTGSIFNDKIDKIKGFAQMNAQIQLNGPSDKWFVRGFIQNIANNNATTGLYVTDQSSGLFTNIFTLEPRRYGIAAGIKF
jgi:iron complex outermembrane recepter protein